MNKNYRRTRPANPPVSGLSKGLYAVCMKSNQSIYTGAAVVALFLLYGFLKGDILLGLVVGALTGLLFVFYGARERLTVGNDWLAFRRIVGTRWVNLNELSSVKGIVTTQGLNFEFTDATKHRVVLLSDIVLADAATKKIIMKAVNRAKRNGADVDRRVTNLLK